MKWIVYDIPPIDFGWHFLGTAEETACNLDGYGDGYGGKEAFLSD